MTGSQNTNGPPPPADKVSRTQRANVPGERPQPGRRSGRGSQDVLKHLRQDSQGKLAPQQAP